MQKSFILTFLVLLVSLVVIFVSVTQLDPYGPQRIIARTAFLLSVLTSVGTFMTFVFFFAVEFITGYTAGTRAFVVALRRGVLVGFLIMILFLLKMNNLLGLVEATLVTIFLALIEFFFLSYKK